ncbi:hypothetical protein SNEBB_004554 [Seison nebaliae]|nr:hypothetical protein SNEBB_004554 [Seison nebaliae]
MSPTKFINPVWEDTESFDLSPDLSSKKMIGMIVGLVLSVLAIIFFFLMCLAASKNVQLCYLLSNTRLCKILTCCNCVNLCNRCAPFKIRTERLLDNIERYQNQRQCFR